MDVQNTAPVPTGPANGSAAAQAPEVSQTTPGIAAPQTEASAAQDHDTLAAVVAKLYSLGQGSSGQAQGLSVSYKYVNDLHEIVTVFTDPDTGAQVQFPPQELVGLAEFFDQVDGVTLDKKV
jgi:uncharacterized FlaG/YvyC family protein